MGEKTELTTCQKGLLWFLIMGIALALFVVGIVLTLRSVQDNAGDEGSGHTSKCKSDESEEEQKDNQFGSFSYAAITAPDPCSAVGKDILARGGSAVDAAIAAILCNGVVNPWGHGIGGGHFMTIYDSSQQMVKTILGRERAPAQATADMFKNGTASSARGGKAIGVPGEIQSFYYAWQRFGKLPWKELVAPSIHLCKHGFNVTKDLKSVVDRFPDYILNDTNLRELLVKDGNLIEEGDFITNEKLGNTFEIIAEDPLAFYNASSQLAKDIVADIEEAGGIITLEDLANYTVYDKDPVYVHIENGNYTMYGPPPPSSAVITEFILNILDGYQFTKSNMDSTDSKVLAYHRMTEAFKYAYGKRTRLGDEEYTDIAELLGNLTSESFANEIRQKIDDNRTYDMMHYEPLFETADDAGTMSVSVVAPDGSAVAVTSTINYYFGSRVRGSRTGIVFNNEMDDFSIPGKVNLWRFRPSPANFIAPGKMPMSSMSPMIILDSQGKVVFVTGGAGGSRIISSTAFVIAHALWFEYDLKEATDMPRIHHQLTPNLLAMEDGFDKDVRAGLEAKGHEIGMYALCNVQSVKSNCKGTMEELLERQKCIDAKSDKRRSGSPDGF